MKKRVTVLFLTAVLAFMCALPAFASSGFNLSVIQNGKDVCTISEDKSKDVYTYSIDSFFKNEANFHICSDDVYVALCPFAYGYSKYGGIGFGVVYFYRESAYPGELYINALSVKVGNKSYNFSELPSTELPQASETYDQRLKGFKGRIAYIALDSGSMAMMEDFIAHRSDTIKASVKADNSSRWSFTLGKTEIDSDIHLYNLFNLAGGLTKANLSFLPAGDATPCEIKKD